MGTELIWSWMGRTRRSRPCIVDSAAKPFRADILADYDVAIGPGTYIGEVMNAHTDPIFFSLYHSWYFVFLNVICTPSSVFRTLRLP